MILVTIKIVNFVTKCSLRKVYLKHYYNENYKKIKDVERRKQAKGIGDKKNRMERRPKEIYKCRT